VKSHASQFERGFVTEFRSPRHASTALSRFQGWRKGASRGPNDSQGTIDRTAHPHRSRHPIASAVKEAHKKPNFLLSLIDGRTRRSTRLQLGHQNKAKHLPEGPPPAIISWIRRIHSAAPTHTDNSIRENTSFGQGWELRLRCLTTCVFSSVSRAHATSPPFFLSIRSSFFSTKFPASLLSAHWSQEGQTTHRSLRLRCVVGTYESNCGSNPSARPPVGYRPGPVTPLTSSTHKEGDPH
jgi:hypothetical protein